MADNVVIVAADGTGKAIDNESLTGVSTTTYRQRIVVAGTTLVEIAVPTTAAPAGAAYGLPVRVAGSVAVSGGHSVTVQAGVSVTVVTQLGTQVVSVVPGVSVTVQAGVSVGTVANITSLSTVVTILGTQVVTVVPGVSVTIQQGASVTGTVAALAVGRTHIMIMVSSSLVAAGGSTMLFTVYQSVTQTVAGVALWVVPAGKTFRLVSLAEFIRNSITVTPVNIGAFVLVSTAAITFTTTVGVLALVRIQASTTGVIYSAQLQGLSQDVLAGQTVGIGKTASTTGNVDTICVHGYLYP